jgi:hypothetical protein
MTPPFSLRNQRALRKILVTAHSLRTQKRGDWARAVAKCFGSEISRLFYAIVKANTEARHDRAFNRKAIDAEVKNDAKRSCT